MADDRLAVFHGDLRHVPGTASAERTDQRRQCSGAHEPITDGTGKFADGPEPDPDGLGQLPEYPLSTVPRP